MEENLEEKPWLLNKIVLPQHTDHAGVMWHGSYIAWLEEARISALANVGLEYGFLSDQGFEIPVIDLNIKYKKPLFHGDHVELRSRVSFNNGLKISWKTEFLKDGIALTSKAKVELVVIKKNIKGVHLTRQLPIYLLEALELLNNGQSF